MTKADVLTSHPVATGRTPVLLLGVFDVLRRDVVDGIADLAALVGPVTVGVLDDATATRRRGRPPVATADDRVTVVRALRGVSEAQVIGLPQLEAVRSSPPAVVLWEVDGGLAGDPDALG